jgi:hypothetical protein
MMELGESQDSGTFEGVDLENVIKSEIPTRIDFEINRQNIVLKILIKIL